MLIHWVLQEADAKMGLYVQKKLSGETTGGARNGEGAGKGLGKHQC